MVILPFLTSSNLLHYLKGYNSNGQSLRLVLYLEGESNYTLSASISEAYDEVENKLFRVGEEVYLSGYSDGNHTGTGAIVSLAVADGDVLQHVDLLFETLDGSFDGLPMSSSQIVAETDGTICTLNLQQDRAIQKDAVAVALYPRDAMHIEAQVSESDLHEIAVGDPVSIEPVWNQDDSILYDGAILRISRIASADAADVCDDVFSDFAPDENTRYGMSSVITTRKSSLNP